MHPILDAQVADGVTPPCMLHPVGPWPVPAHLSNHHPPLLFTPSSLPVCMLLIHFLFVDRVLLGAFFARGSGPRARGLTKGRARLALQILLSYNSSAAERSPRCSDGCFTCIVHPCLPHQGSRVKVKKNQRSPFSTLASLLAHPPISQREARGPGQHEALLVKGLGLGLGLLGLRR
jgi:hypothetical protein